MKTEHKRIIYALLFLLGLYFAMVTFTALNDYRYEHSRYHSMFDESPQPEPLGAWAGAGTFLLMILSFLSCFGCVIGIAYNIFAYLKEKNLI
jgi:hypothetical protein